MHTLTRQSIGKEVMLRVLPDGQHLAPLADEDIWACVKAYGSIPHENFFPSIAKHVKPGGVAVDCGAFIGDHTQQLCSMGFETVAIEPFLDTFVCLCYNSPWSRNILGAVGNGDPVFCYNDCPGTNHGMRRVALDPKGTPSIRIDALGLDALDFLKVDVEGFEVFALEGGRQTILKHHPVMWIECFDEYLRKNGHTHQDLRDAITGLGYRIEQFGDGAKCDLLCLPNP